MNGVKSDLKTLGKGIQEVDKNVLSIGGKVNHLFSMISLPLVGSGVVCII